MKKLFFTALMCVIAFSMSAQTYVDLGLPSGTKWATTNEQGHFTYDQAVNKFRSNLPTKEQWEELMDYCQWNWTGRGFKLIGPNEKSIFLPAEGSRNCDWVLGNGVGKSGDYWSSTPIEPTQQEIEWGDIDSWDLGFGESGARMASRKRCSGRSVRLVK